MTLVRQNPERYEQTLADVPPEFQTLDGHTLYSRLIQPSDANALLAFFERLSSKTRRRRFHTDADHLSYEAKRDIAVELSSVDNRTDGGAVLAIDRADDGTESIVGVARLARPYGATDTSVAESAVVVQDTFQGKGVGTELMFRMVLLAKQMNVETLVAEFESTNQAAIRLFREINLPTKISAHRGETTLRITVAST